MPVNFEEKNMFISTRYICAGGAFAFALTSFASIHYASAARWPSQQSLSLQKPIVLTRDGGILPSQRPRYLSGSAGSTNSRFSANDAGPNVWGLHPILPTEGIVTLKPGETYRTAGNADLGARAAGAAHGRALPASETGVF
jgi:hypothetical protein